ncbi:uncharacterized protein DS421_12g377790 [Arachis hypogaea]|nr:uncharacterized protein DS421_12g377790 [Arachis hypogaea]
MKTGPDRPVQLVSLQPSSSKVQTPPSPPTNAGAKHHRRGSKVTVASGSKVAVANRGRRPPSRVEASPCWRRRGRQLVVGTELSPSPKRGSTSGFDSLTFYALGLSRDCCHFEFRWNSHKMIRNYNIILWASSRLEIMELALSSCLLRTIVF